jgi:hypothetical protein
MGIGCVLGVRVPMEIQPGLYALVLLGAAGSFWIFK